MKASFLRSSIRNGIDRLALCVWLATWASAVAPAPSGAGVPDPTNHVIPSQISIVGQDGAGTADPAGEFLILLRDLANQPVSNAVVVLDFSACTELRLCSDPLDPAATVNCSARTITKVANAQGEVRFRVVGCSVAGEAGPGAGFNCCNVYVDGMYVGAPSVAIYDLTGCNGLGAPDIACWLADLYNDTGTARGDYDNSGSLGAADLAMWLGVFFGSRSVANCGNGGHCGP